MKWVGRFDPLKRVKLIHGVILGHGLSPSIRSSYYHMRKESPTMPLPNHEDAAGSIRSALPLPNESGYLTIHDDYSPRGSFRPISLHSESSLLLSRSLDSPTSRALPYTDQDYGFPDKPAVSHGVTSNRFRPSPLRLPFLRQPPQQNTRDQPRFGASISWTTSRSIPSGPTTPLPKYSRNTPEHQPTVQTRTRESQSSGDPPSYHSLV